MEYEKARIERIKQLKAKMKELRLRLTKTSFKGTIRRKDKNNTNLEKDAENMASTGNKKPSSDPIDLLSSHKVETISVHRLCATLCTILSPTNLVTNVELSEGPKKEIVDGSVVNTHLLRLRKKSVKV
ncbi:hypothetical protein M8C21_023932 [Ambrosia artemisiifolia]|uniref:Uncharacterized protein n=1 Tax=Ambrosia artemisiifolia TaxID=4212 RepID=A0AAD5BXZ4_AMBAR|nr:hypothetical protein M8C21_023932 [Ambrosia artemisiifolia]